VAKFAEKFCKNGPGSSFVIAMKLLTFARRLKDYRGHICWCASYAPPALQSACYFQQGWMPCGAPAFINGYHGRDANERL
jgi:hypothetical protein